MAASSGSIGQWHALPFPLRLAALFIAGMAVIWLTRWLGAASVLVALLLWCAVGVGLMHASGWLAGLDRFPGLTRILESFAPRFALASTVVSKAAPARAPPPPHEAYQRPPTAVPAVDVDLSGFVGIDGVLADIDELVAMRAGRISPVAQATLVLLVGPRGTGKSSVAIALAAKLHRLAHAATIGL